MEHLKSIARYFPSDFQKKTRPPKNVAPSPSDGSARPTKNNVDAKKDIFEKSSPSNSRKTSKTSTSINKLPSALNYLAEITHMSVKEQRQEDGELKLQFVFGPTANDRDIVQDFSTAFGLVGEVLQATEEAASLVAEALHNSGSTASVDLVTGSSMGGGSAQMFVAALSSQCDWADDKSPRLVVFDPMLLNNAQARTSTKQGQNGYDFSKPRGVAITLDYAEAPHKGLMNVMKSAGYKSPGLVQLRLGLTDGDDGPMFGHRPPQTSGPPGLGYHVNGNQYNAAINRFVSPASIDDQDSPSQGHSLLDEINKTRQELNLHSLSEEDYSKEDKPNKEHTIQLTSSKLQRKHNLLYMKRSKEYRTIIKSLDDYHRIRSNTDKKDELSRAVSELVKACEQYIGKKDKDSATRETIEGLLKEARQTFDSLSVQESK